MQQTLEVLLQEVSSIDFCNITWPTDDFAIKRKETCERLNNWCRICDRFQETPQLLDKQLGQLVTQLAFWTKHSLETLQRFIESVEASHLKEEEFTCFCSAFIALYHISKVRGFKYVAKFFPSQVDDFLTVLQIWQIFQKIRTFENFPWQVAYVLLLWLSKLSLLPFSLNNFSVENAGETTLLVDVIAFAKQTLSDSSTVQYSAAYFLAKILTRQDMQHHLTTYLEEFLTMWEQSDREDISEMAQIGNLRTIAWILEFGTRDSFCDIAERLLSTFVTQMHATTNIVIRQLCVKNVQRLALLFLPKKGASWLHKKRFVKLNDESSKEVTENASETTVQDDTIDEPTGGFLATIMETLLNMLDNKHTVTRYSVAKGIGRICMRLPQRFANQALELLLSNVENNIGIHDGHLWHGACLTLAECARRGILDEKYLQLVLNFIFRALRYDFAKGSLHTGSQVRDAACYVCWALARSYNFSIPPFLLKELASNIVCVACTDRELNCRRAAAAALQELVGRTNLVSQGIFVITSADYFSLGDLSDSYLKILPKIAFLDYEWYRLPLVNELICRKITHWDPIIRQLASTSLAIVITKELDFMRETLQSTMENLVINIHSDDPNVCHGSVLSIYQLLRSIQEEVNVKTMMDQFYIELVRFIQNQVDNTSLDSIQIATCELLGCFFERKLYCEPQFVRKIVKMMQSENEQVQDAAARAFGSICSYLCFKFENSESDDAIQQCAVDVVFDMIRSIRSERNLKKRGFIKALGYVPYCILDCKLIGTDETLRMAILAEFLKLGKKPKYLDIPGTLEEDSEEAVELKITCIESITHFAIHTLQKMNNNVIFCFTELEDVLQLLLGGMDDYTIGSRGDIGSWVRITSMKCFGNLITFMNDHIIYQVENHLKYGIQRLVRNCFERIDKTRLVAAETLKTLHDKLDSHSLHRSEMDVLQDILHNFEASFFLAYDRLFQGGILLLQRSSTFGLSVLLGFLAAFGTSSVESKEAHKAMECYLKDVANDSPDIITKLLRNLQLVLTSDNETRRNSISIIRMLTLILETVTKIDSEMQTILNELFRSLIQCTKGSKDVNMLLAFTEMLVEALIYQDTVGHVATQRLMLYLLHPFAKVRQFVSDRMQIQMLTNEDYFVQALGLDRYQKAIEILEQVRWDKDSPTTLKEERNRLCITFGLAPPNRQCLQNDDNTCSHSLLP